MKGTKRHLFAAVLTLVLVSNILLFQIMCFADETGDVALPENVTAVDPTDKDQSFAAIVYDNTNGLPTSEANDIAETGEGFIWIGSYSGLIRYDGNSFERIDSVSTGISSVKCLFVDSKNRLWIGSNDNGLVLMEGDELYKWTVKDGLPSSAIRSITEDSRGVFYISTTGGIVTIDQDMNLSTMSDSRMAENYMHDLRLAKDGSIYGVSNDGDLFVIKDGEVVSFLDKEIIQGDGVNCVFPDPEKEGYVYMETKDSEISYGSLDDLEHMEIINIEPLSQVTRFEYINGKIWICARNGLGVLDDDGFRVMDNLPMNNSVGRVITDYAGNIWLTSTRQGVMKIVPNQFEDYFARYGLSEEVVNSTCMYEGRLFVATDTGLKVLGDEGIIESIPVTAAENTSQPVKDTTDLIALLDGCRIRSIIRDSRDRLWICTWRSLGLLCYDHGELRAFTSQDGLFSDMVRSVYEMEDGRIILANSGGVVVLGDDGVLKTYDESDGIENTEILTVCEGANGDIICGTDGGGIFVISSEGLKHIGMDEGLTSESVMRVKPDLSRDLFWVVTGTSLAYLTADYELHTVDKFPYSNNFDLYENSKGDMWVLSSNGIYIVPVNELIENENIDPIHYGISDGLSCIATANSYSEVTDEGDLYIAGSTGVAKLNVEETFEGYGELKAAVPCLEADGEMIYPGENGDFTISSDVRKLTIYAFVYNYSLIDPQVTYRLEGFDNESIKVKRSELGAIDYTNLRGGNYKFVMEIKDSIHRGANTLSVNIIKQKAFFEYPWFYLLSGALAMLVIGILVRLYVKKKIRLMEIKNREQAEKERIATELDMSKRIQESVLPGETSVFPDRDDFEICATMDPAREVGGDFYDYFMTDDDHLCMVIADVSGKGIPAALFMMKAKSTLKNFAMRSQSPSQILEKTNEDMCDGNNTGMFVTVWMGILELSTGKLTTANAGHDYPALKRKDGEFELVKAKHGLVLGGMVDTKYKENQVYLQPGDRLFLYTDGVTEATDAEKNLFGNDRMIEALNRSPDAESRQLLSNVREAVDEFVRDEEQFDDLTMMCLDFKKTAKE